MNNEQLNRMQNDAGFIAALDQSGGSTPKALQAYGVTEAAYSNDEEMFDLVHAMRVRIMTSDAFSGNFILAAILFKETMERQVEGVDSAEYLWGKKRIVPFLKVDNGLEDQKDGVQLMKSIPDLEALLARAKEKGIFGTKMRSVIAELNVEGIAAAVDQQFEVARRIMSHGLVPIIEPEVSIQADDKKQIEAELRTKLSEQLDRLDSDQLVMLKLTIPDEDNFYSELISHPNVVRVVALSGGYERDDANARLARNNGLIASFSRALSEGLLADQTEQEFNDVLASSVQSIFEASRT